MAKAKTKKKPPKMPAVTLSEEYTVMASQLMELLQAPRVDVTQDAVAALWRAELSRQHTANAAVMRAWLESGSMCMPPDVQAAAWALVRSVES